MLTTAPKTIETTEKPLYEMAQERGTVPLSFGPQLWSAADRLRGHLDAAEYKHIVLGLIFLRFLSTTDDVPLKQMAFVLKDEAATNRKNGHRNGSSVDLINFAVPEEASWRFICGKAHTATIGRALDRAMEALEQANPILDGALPKIFARTGLAGSKLGELIGVISEVDFTEYNGSRADILGRVYEYFLGRFASTEGKRGGEFYTPPSIVKLLVEMLEPFSGTVYDPCCGSGGLFIQSQRFIDEHGGKLGELRLFGQESNPGTWRLARMNMAIHGLKVNLGLRAADTFSEDLHSNLRADYILANPPFNMSDWTSELMLNDPRWTFGKPNPGNANFAWIQHMIQHLSPRGRTGFVMANGSLSVQSGSDSEIRRAIVDADLVDCIVSLPSQLFFNTSIPVSLWFLARDKSDERYRDRRGKTLFIDARELGTMVDRTHRMLTDADVSAISSAYLDWCHLDGKRKDAIQPGFSAEATIEEIRFHRYALVPGRYVGFAPREFVRWNPKGLRKELIEIEQQLAGIETASRSALALLRELLHG
jgi:type I restriction enzyme M protein